MSEVCHAQGKNSPTKSRADQSIESCFNQEFEYQQKTFGKPALQKLTTLEDFDDRRHPICKDVVGVFNQVLEKTNEVFSKKCLPFAADLFSPTHKILIVNDTAQIAQRTSARINSKTGDGQYFTKDTLLTIRRQTGDANKDSAQSIQISRFARLWNPSNPPYILASPVDEIPKAAEEYLQPCWTVPTYFKELPVQDGLDMCKITYSDGISIATCNSLPSTTMDVICDDENDSICEWKFVSEINNQMHLVSDTNKPVKIINVEPEKIQDWAAGTWFEYIDLDLTPDASLYRLSTLTGTFYIGDQDHRILVHN
jgi:hypothetical protein